MTDQPAVRPWKTGRPELGGPGLRGPAPEGPGPGPSGQEARRPAQAAGPQPPDPRECPLAGPRAAQPSLEALRQRPAPALASMGPGARPRPGLRGERSPPDHRRRSEEHTSELQSLRHLVCRLLLEKKKKKKTNKKLKKKKEKQNKKKKKNI